MAEHTCKGIKIENFIFECLFHSNHINGTGGTKTEIITNVQMYKNKGTRGNLIYSVKTEIRSLATCAFFFG